MQLRNLPSVDAVLATARLRSLAEGYRRDWLVELVRHRVAEAREAARNGAAPPRAEEIYYHMYSKTSITHRFECVITMIISFY